MPTVEHVKDMQFSDSFHRVKRASLAYSAGVLVLAWIDPGRPVKAPGLDIAMPVDDELAFLWVAAAYYFIGFILEYRNAKRQNSRLATREGGTVDERLGYLLKEWEDVSSLTIPLFKKFVDGFVGAVSRVSDDRFVGTTYDGDIRKKFPDKEAWLKRVTDEALRSVDDRGKSSYFTESNMLALIQKIVEEVFESVLNSSMVALQEIQYALHGQLTGPISEFQKISAGTDDLRRSIKAVRTEVTTLMDGIGLERRVLFTWWDLGGVTVTFVVATGLVVLAEWHHVANLVSRLL